MRKITLAVIMFILPFASSVFADISSGVLTYDNNGTNIIKADYFCERGVVLPISFINDASGNLAVAVMNIEGKQIVLNNAPVGSGAYYISIDEQQSYRLHTKNDDAIVTFLAADHTAKEQTVLRECKIITAHQIN